MYEPQSVMERTFLLNNGVTLPAVGLSTYRARSEPTVYNVIDCALEAGYRLFDTSMLYCNEVMLRNALANLLPKYHLDRRDIFLSSKLIVTENADYTTIRAAFDRTLTNLGTDYLDMYLISSSVENSTSLKNAWEALKIIHSEGYIGTIGVANFNVEQLRDIMEDSGTPSVNQVEWHPLKRNDALYKYCCLFNIQLQAYSPFGTPFANHKRLLENRIVKRMAAKYEMTPAQIILMWSLQQDVAVVPAACDAMHLKQNIDFDMKLSQRDMMRISWLAPDPDESDFDV